MKKSQPKVKVSFVVYDGEIYRESQSECSAQMLAKSLCMARIDARTITLELTPSEILALIAAKSPKRRKAVSA